MPPVQEQTGLVCVPSAIPADRRAAHLSLAQRLLRQLACERVSLPNGYALRYTLDALPLVAEFVANECRCCPFIDFEISVSASTGSLWLRMTGPEGTRELLDAELGLLACREAATCCKN